MLTPCLIWQVAPPAAYGRSHRELFAAGGRRGSLLAGGGAAGEERKSGGHAAGVCGQGQDPHIHHISLCFLSLADSEYAPDPAAERARHIHERAMAANYAGDSFLREFKIACMPELVAVQGLRVAMAKLEMELPLVAVQELPVVTAKL